MQTMPYTKEERKEYNRLYRLKNKEFLREKNRLYRIKNPQYAIDYRKTDKCKKSYIIGNWKRYGVECFDWNLLYDVFIKVSRCDYCNVELNTNTKTRRCLDHDHNIQGQFNVRGVLCLCCNVKDVYKKI